ncbi:MAG: Ig-like domain-containing protein [Betaproteobacteria bacterium]
MALQPLLAELADGTVSFDVRSIDGAGNSTAAPARTLALRQRAPAPPTEVRLTEATDTAGRDNVTSSPAPQIEGRTGAGYMVRVYRDNNLDGLPGTLEFLGSVTADPAGRFVATTPTLPDGLHQFLFQAVDEFGNVSTSSTALRVTVDTIAVPPLLDTVANDNLISYAEAILPSVLFSGKAEPGAGVRIRLTHDTTTLEHQVIAAANGDWSLAVPSNTTSLTDRPRSLMFGFGEHFNGEVDVEVIQVDVAGNVSAATTRTLYLRTDPLPDISRLALGEGQDTGRSNTDGVTRLRTVGLDGTGPAGMLVRVYRDDNGDGSINALQDTFLQEFATNAEGRFQGTVTLPGSGRHSLLAVAFDPASGTLGSLRDLPVKLDLLVDSEVGLVGFDTVAGDNRVNLSETAISGGVTLSGTGEAGARVALVLTAGSLEDSSYNNILVGDDGCWSTLLTLPSMQALGNGMVSLKATQTDVAGNTTVLADSHVREFEIRLGVLEAPRNLALAAEDDTGASATDAITRNGTGLTLQGTSAAGYSIAVFDDANADGLQSPGELLGTVTALEDGRFSLDVSLAEGTHRIRAEARDGLGQTSGASTALVIRVDATVAPVSGMSLTANNIINANEGAAGLGTLTGTAEPGAEVRAEFLDGGNVRATRTTIAAAGTGLWSITLQPADLEALGEGAKTARIVQQDVAGNTSGPATLAFAVDTSPVGTPGAGSEALARAFNESAERPWRDGAVAGAITWDEIQTYVGGVAVPRTVPVAVPLGDGALAGDSLRLFWGTKAVQHTVSAADLARGYALVNVTGDLIAANREQQSVVNVSASFTDQAGNQGAAFTVLANVDASLANRPPTLTVDPADFASSDVVTNTAYTRFSAANGFMSERTLHLDGRGAPGDRIIIFDDRNLDGIPDADAGEVLTQVDADEFGNYIASLSLDPGTYRLRAIGSNQVGASLAPSPTNVLNLVVDVAAPAAPVLAGTTIAGDDRVGAPERDGMPVVRLSGTAEPGATISLQLTNATTGVVGGIRRGIPVAADGTWSTDISTVQWGQVGDGSIKLRIAQIDRAGNISAYVTRQDGSLPTVVMDTSARAPSVDIISVDDRINASEAAAATVITGGAEPLGQVVLTLTGTGGSRGPITVPVDAEGRWFHVLDAATVAALGNGTAQVDAFQIDLAGNRSDTTVRNVTIDTQVAPPTISVVAGNDTVNASEKALGVRVDGMAEPGATVELTAVRGATSLPVRSVIAGSGGAWSITLSAADVETLGDGNATLSARQIDAAGNPSASTSRAVAIATGPLATPVTVGAVSGDDLVSVAEQQAGITLAGSGPANTQLVLRLDGTFGTLDRSAAVASDGTWTVQLSQADLQSSLGSGDVSLSAYAVNAEQQSTALTRRTFRIELLEPSPTVSRVSGDGFVNALEAQGNLVVSGGGEAEHVVSVTFRGAGTTVIERVAAVGADRKWTVSLTPGELADLGNGTVAISAVQKASTAPGAAQSLVTTAEFRIDTLAPLAPYGSDTSQANAYNSAVSDLSGGVTLAEASDGVTIAVALPQDAVAGDRLVVRWGTSEISRVLQEEDVPLLGTRVVNVEIPTGTIVSAGSGVLDVSVVYFDGAGNASAPVILASNVNVAAPPQAPQFGAVYGDGYVNAAEYAGIVASGGRLAGTAAGSGHVVLTLTGPGGQVVSFPSVAVSGGAWSANLTAEHLVLLGEGRISAQAVFHDISGAQSAPATLAFFFDRTTPGIPDTARLLAAAELNARNELSGGLIRVGGAVTEAASPARVNVALAADAVNGDSVTLFWGGQTLNTVVQASDVERGYVTVSVSPFVMSQEGDRDNLVVEARVTDRAGNTGARYAVWNGPVDAAPPGPEIQAIAGNSYVNLAEATAGWVITGRGVPTATVSLAVTGSRLETGGTAATVAKTGIAVDDAGQWQVTLSLAEAQALGNGPAAVAAVQYDGTGNPSGATTRAFEIDLSVPTAPTIDPVTTDNRVSFAESQLSVPLSGTGETGARVDITLSHAGVTLTKTVMAAGGTWSTALAPAELTALGGGPVPIVMTVRQTDPAGNVSPMATREFRYSTDAVPVPVVASVTGITPGSDLYFNAADLATMNAGSGQFTVSGTGNGAQAGNRVRLTLRSADDASYSFEIPVTAGSGAWSRALSVAEFSALGQGEIRITAVQLSPEGDESVPVAYVTGNERNAFFIDTVAPRLLSAAISATGFGGNARAGDQVVVTALASEPVTLAGLDPTRPPTVTLDLGSGQSRVATYDAALSTAAGAGRLVFTYTVVAGDSANGVSLANATVALNGATLRDDAGNAAQNDIATAPSSPLLIDTVAPAAPVIAAVDPAGLGTPGGATVNKAEAAQSVRVRVGLAGTGAQAGDTVLLDWRVGTDSTVISKQVTSADLTAGQASVLVAQTVVGLLEGTVALSAVLRDAAGNLSPASPVLPLAVDTIAPVAPGFSTWLTDNKVNKAEVDGNLITALEGTAVEAGATVSALLVQGGTQIPLSVQLDGTGRWSVSKPQMVSAINSIQDGSFAVYVTQTDAAGNASDAGSRGYYVDRIRPGRPAIVSIPLADDGWVNLRDANVNGVAVRVSLADTGVSAGDSLVITGFTTNHVHTVTAEQAAAGLAVVNLPAAVVLQPDGTLPQMARPVRVSIEDQGGNVSDLSDSVLVNVDTIVLTPLVDTTRGAASGVTKAQSRANVDFFGGGAEPGATVQVRMTGVLGNSFLLPTTAAADGSYKVTLSPTDMADLGDGTVSYEVTQIDAALNISAVRTGGFDLALTVRPPTLLLMTADNVVSAAEARVATAYTGLGVPGSTVDLAFSVRRPDGVFETTPRLVKTAIPVNGSGVWSVTLSSADFTAVSPYGQGVVQIKGVQVDTDGSRSGETTAEFYIDRFAPTLATSGALRLFDGNGDGANNDGVLFTFAEPVLVSEIRKITSYILQSGRTLGTDARVEAVDSASINGQYYATQFRLYLDGDHNLTTGNTITINRAAIFDAGGNQATANQVLTLPAFVPPGLPTPPIDIMDDNRINVAESSDVRRLVFRSDATPAQMNAALGGLLQTQLDGVVTDRVIPKANFLTVDLTLAKAAKLNQDAASSAVVRVSFQNGTTQNITVYSTGDPVTSASAQTVYRYTSREIIDLVNVTGISYVSSNLWAFTLPESVISRTSVGGVSTFTATLKFPNSVRLASGQRAWADMYAYFTDINRWETVRLQSAPGTSTTAAGATELTYTVTVNRPTSSEFFWESYGNVSLDPAITVVTSGANAPAILAGYETSVVVPTAQLDGIGGDVLTSTLLDKNLNTIAGTGRTLAYSVENPNKLEFTQSLADALSAAGRRLVLFVDGRPVSDPITMGISSLFLNVWANWENQAGNAMGWGAGQRVQAGEDITATVRVTFKTPIAGQTFRDVVLKATGSQILSNYPLQFTGAFPADIPATNVRSIAYVSGSISSLHPQQKIAGTSINTNQLVDLPIQAWAGQEDGLKQLTAQITTADGSLTSVFSAPKQIRLDRDVASVTDVRLVTDTNTNGTLDAGDVVQLRFDENVQFTFSALPVAFGTNPVLTPIGAENGFASLWNVRLGTGATLLPGQSFTLEAGKVFDMAGNANSAALPVTATLPAGLMTAAATPILDNVSDDNVISSTAGATAVRVLLNRARAGDVVKLRLDGVEVASATVAADNQADISFNVAGVAWGADGERQVVSTLTRSGVTTASTARSVYVQADQTHWSQEAAFAGRITWFDPDALAVADGSVVTTWQASAGGISVANTVAGTQTLKLTDVYTGRAFLLTDAGSIFYETKVGGAYLYQAPTMARFTGDATMPTAGFTDFMLFKPVVEGSQTMMQHPTWRFTSNSAVTTYTPLSGGTPVTVQPYTRMLNSHVTRYTFGGLSSQVNATSDPWWMMYNATMSNAMSLGAWQFVTEAVRGNVMSVYNQMRFNVSQTLQNFVPNADNPLSSRDYQNLSIDNGLRRFRIGGGYGVVGDQISISVATDWAYTQEIGAYLAAKYQSAGALMARESDRTYDLFTSNVPGAIIDQILRLNDAVSDDTVVTAGADYVTTGSGNDTVRLRDLAFRLIDGGLGTDTLALDDNYVGRSDIILSDYVSNARGLSGSATDNRRVNDAGYHRLMGFEVLDLVQDGATENRRQILTVAAADVKQLSETGTLELLLGKEDVLRTAGFAVNAGTPGIYSVNNRWYDRRYTMTDTDGTWTLYSSGGDRPPEAVSFKNIPALKQVYVNFDHSMLGSFNAGDFSVTTYSGPSVFAQSAVSIDLRQGVALTLSGTLDGVTKITYNGTAVDDGGRGFAHNVWLLGTDGKNTLSGLVLTAAEQSRGATFLGGAADDTIVGAAGSDLIVGGVGADILTGGLGSDTFLYRNEISGSGGSGGLGGASGDIITDFTFSASNPANNDRIDLSLLFEDNFKATGNASRDATALSSGGFMELIKRVNLQTSREDLQIWVDRDGGGAMGLLATVSDGATNLPDNYPAVESSRDFLERLLTEGRLVVSHF